MQEGSIYNDSISKRPTSRSLGGNRSISAGARDLVSGAAAVSIWFRLGWQDIRQRYRRSSLGPMWLTASLAITIAAMGFLYSRLFQQEPGGYVPFLAMGLVIWTFISSLITEGCLVFIQAEGIIKQVRLPLSLHVFRMTWRNTIVLLHHALIIPFIAVAFGLAPHWSWLSIPLGVLAVAATFVLISLVFGALCARFRDIPQIMQSLVQILFFVTPVIWKPESLSSHRWVVDWNPIYHYVEIIRAPLIRMEVPLGSWVFVAACTPLVTAVSLWFFGRCRPRIPYWV